jgi:hypothetical protein
MKNAEVTHVVRLYNADFIARLSALMEMEQSRYRNKNEFLTAVMMMGYNGYIAAAKKAGGAQPEITAPVADGGADASDTYALLTAMNEYMILQFNIIAQYREIHQRLLSSSHRMLLALTGGEKVTPSKIEQGLFDDLPVRFEKIIAALRAKAGVK